MRGADGETLGEPAVNGTELAYFGGGDETLAAAHEAEAEAFAEATRPISAARPPTMRTTSLQAMVLDGSALSGELEELRGADGADGRDVKRVRVRDGSFTGVGATCFVCTADVQYAPAEEGGENVETAYTIVFVMNGGVWLAASVVS